MKNIFDLNAPVKKIDKCLIRDKFLSNLVKRNPGIRVPGSFNSYELCIRAIVGQQVSVRGATTIIGRIASKYGKKLPVKLFLYDDQSRPDKCAENTERLILKDEVHGLLSAATPPNVIPAAVIADREGIPMSAAMCPIRAFLGARDQWTWVWDLFFDELDMTRQQFLTMDTLKSNRKVALFTDNEQDGQYDGPEGDKLDFKRVLLAFLF